MWRHSSLSSSDGPPSLPSSPSSWNTAPWFKRPRPCWQHHLCSQVLTSKVCLPLVSHLPLTGRINENTTWVLFSSLLPQRHVVIFDQLKVTPSSVISAHMVEQHEIVVRWPDESGQPFHDICDILPSRQQTSWPVDQASRWMRLSPTGGNHQPPLQQRS